MTETVRPAKQKKNAYYLALYGRKWPKPSKGVWPCASGSHVRPTLSKGAGPAPTVAAVLAASAAPCRVAEAVLAALHQPGSRVWNIVLG